MKISAKLLRQMGETAYAVRQWGQRRGLKKEQQVEEIVNGLKADLRDFGIQFEEGEN